MGGEFEICWLWGSGSGSIRVKGKGVKEEMNNIKEEVVKVVVEGVEREVSVVEKGGGKIVERWGSYFSMSGESSWDSLDGSKRGERVEIGV